MKQNIPSGNYQLISSTYLSILDGGGHCCENCGRIIANIVNVKHETGKHYLIGADCAKTILSKQDIDQATKDIKTEKKRQEDAPKIEARRRWDIAYEDLRQMEDQAGINNSNINEQWSRDKYNELLVIIEAKHNIERFSYRR